MKSRIDLDTQEVDMRHGSSIEHGSAHSLDHQRWSRRGFLKSAGLVGLATPLLIGGSAIKSFADASSAALIRDLPTDRILLIIQLQGGVDGLNMVVPLSTQKYYDSRPDIALDAVDTFPLTGQYGMNNSLGDLRDLWDDGDMTIIQGVGYDFSSLSHFRGTDIWNSSSPDVLDNTGWVGRTLDAHYPNFEMNPPDAPLAVEIDSASSMLFRSEETNMGMSLRNPEEFYRLAQNGGLYDTTAVPSDSHGDELAFLRSVANFTVRYASEIKNAADLGSNALSYPNTELAERLSIVSRLIKGGLGARIYKVQIGSFDTHSAQLTRMNNLFTELGGAIKTFYDDLDADGLGEKVLTMTYSEFGRRIEQNGSGGTDHGTAAPQLIIGKGTVNGGFMGTEPDLDDPDYRGNLNPTTDFRNLYGSVLTEWFGVDCNQAYTTLDYDYENLLVVKNPEVTSANCALPIELAMFEAVQLTDGRVQLNWSTNNELNNAGFEIERLFLSGNQEVWTKLGFLEGAGTSRSTREYSFINAVPQSGKYRFRLKQIDFNGSISFSNRVEIDIELPENFGRLLVYPNPITRDAQIRLELATQSQLDLKIYDNSGRVVKELGRISHSEDSVSEVQFSVEDLAAGNYILVAESNDLLLSKLLIVAH